LIQIPIGYVELSFAGIKAMWTKIATAALAVGLGLAGLATPSTAKTVLIFAQNGATPPTNFDIVDHGNGTTSISASLSVVITALDGPLVPPPITDAVFTFSATSTTAASTFTAGGITFLVERFSGTFAIDAPECGAGGDCLSGTFVDLLNGPVGGRALTVAASQPPASAVTFTSDIIPIGDLAIDRAMALSATNLDSPVSFDCLSPLGCTLGSTSSNLSGTFSSDVAINTPEPSTWVMLMLGFAGMGFAGFRSSKPKLALVD
jgi:PEP-CTERM motif